MNLPNTITLLRILLVPLLVYALLRQQYSLALSVFLVASLSDALDGYLARRMAAQSRLGAILDPIADKLLVVTTVVMLTWQAWIPYWLTLIIVLRDLVIVSGAFAFHRLIGRVDFVPTYLSKINTVVQFMFILLVLLEAAGWPALATLRQPAVMLVLVTTLSSGLHYVWVWGAKAFTLGNKQSIDDAMD